MNREDILDVLYDMSAVDTKFRKFATVLGINQRVIWYFHPEPVEEILSSNVHISKSAQYSPLLVSLLDKS